MLEVVVEELALVEYQDVQEIHVVQEVIRHPLQEVQQQPIEVVAVAVEGIHLLVETVDQEL